MNSRKKLLNLFSPKQVKDRYFETKTLSDFFIPVWIFKYKGLQNFTFSFEYSNKNANIVLQTKEYEWFSINNCNFVKHLY